MTATSTPRARQLGVGGGGQRLELRDAVVVGSSVRSTERGGVRGALRRRRRTRVGSRSRVVDADALGERDEVRRQVGAGAQAVALQDRGDHPHRRGLAVRADDVDRVEARARGWPSAVISRRMRSRPKRMPNSSSDEQVALGVLERVQWPRAHSALQLLAQARELRRARPATTAGGALATKPSLASLPSRARSRPRASRARSAQLALGRAEVDGVAGADLDGAAGDRRPTATGSSPSPPSRSRRASRATCSAVSLVAVGLQPRAGCVAPA